VHNLEASHALKDNLVHEKLKKSYYPEMGIYIQELYAPYNMLAVIKLNLR
jgi:hypothetical protein